MPVPEFLSLSEALANHGPEGSGFEFRRMHKRFEGESIDFRALRLRPTLLLPQFKIVTVVNFLRQFRHPPRIRLTLHRHSYA